MARTFAVFELPRLAVVAQCDDKDVPRVAQVLQTDPPQLALTSYWGGQDRGVSLQLDITRGLASRIPTLDPALASTHAFLTREDAVRLHNALGAWLKESGEGGTIAFLPEGERANWDYPSGESEG